MKNPAILLCMVLYTSTWAIHAQRSAVHASRLPVEYPPDEHTAGNEMTAMDEIIKTNEYQAVQVIDSTTNLRDGDIAVSTGRHSKSCFARSCLWNKSVDGHVYIPYRLSSEYNELDKQVIMRGMQDLEDGTCVRFVPCTHQRDYLDIQPKSGCWSYLGQRGGRQTVSLQYPDCMLSGVASHELMHAMGFMHEQSRADRDNYVTIMWPKIWRDRVRNFEKFKTNNLDMPYDYGSIMHFGMYAYSNDGDPTIVPKRSRGVQLGQRSSPSHLDKLKINKLYDCDV